MAVLLHLSLQKRVMKKLTGIVSFALLLVACGGTAGNNDNNSATTTDSAGLTNPSSIDTTKHPEGMSNQNVISTDTAAMNVQNAINKAKEAEKKHK
jgi:hypothetical protein